MRQSDVRMKLIGKHDIENALTEIAVTSWDGRASKRLEKQWASGILRCVRQGEDEAKSGRTQQPMVLLQVQG